MAVFISMNHNAIRRKWEDVNAYAFAGTDRTSSDIPPHAVWLAATNSPRCKHHDF
jgi:hypothetical protein